MRDSRSFTGMPSTGTGCVAGYGNDRIAKARDLGRTSLERMEGIIMPGSVSDSLPGRALLTFIVSCFSANPASRWRVQVGRL